MNTTGMTVEFAHGVILTIGVIGMGVWLIALILWLAKRRMSLPDPAQRELPEKDPKQVRDSLPRAAALQTPPWDLIGGDATHAIFSVPVPARPQVRVDVDPQPPGCRVTADVQRYDGGWWLGWVIPGWLVLEFLAILALGIFLWTAVAPNSNPNIRGQAWQMVQIVHFLWPPFMFMGMRWLYVKTVRYQRDRFLTTVELL